MKAAALVIGLVGFLIVISIFVARFWLDIDAAGYAGVSWIGLLAMGGGIILTLALGIGLMALVFYSNRKGYDDDVHKF